MTPQELTNLPVGSMILKEGLALIWLYRKRDETTFECLDAKDLDQWARLSGTSPLNSAINWLDHFIVTDVTSDFNPTPFVLPDLRGYVGPSQCLHEYVRYVGFTEEYEYCKHCNERKGN